MNAYLKSCLLTCLSILTLAFPTLAIANTQIVYNDGMTSVVTETVEFPGKGLVLADKVCVTANRLGLKTDVAATAKNVCVESYIDHTDSTRPQVVCTKSEMVYTRAETWSRPVSMTKNTCEKWSVDYTDSTRPVKTCLSYHNEQIAQKLSYEVKSYRMDDYRHESPTYNQVMFPTCK